MVKYLICLLIAVTSSSALANTWFNDIGGSYNRIEQEVNGTIWLMRPLTDAVPLNISGCSFSQVKLNPPAGREDSYLSMVLAAIASKGKVNIWGTCSANTTVVGTRLHIEL